MGSIQAYQNKTMKVIMIGTSLIGIEGFFLFPKKNNPYRVASVPKHFTLQINEDNNPGSSTDTVERALSVLSQSFDSVYDFQQECALYYTPPRSIDRSG